MYLFILAIFSIKPNSIQFVSHVISFNTSRFGRLITDWLVECVNPDLIPYEALLDVSINGFIKDTTNKLILIRLSFIYIYKIIILVYMLCFSGVDRLAGITLNNPVHIDISQSNDHAPSDDTFTEPKNNFTLPQNLRQHFVITPPKLRLVTLAAFISWHCKVRCTIWLL